MKKQTKLVSNIFRSMRLKNMTILPDSEFIGDHMQHNLRVDFEYDFEGEVVDEYVEFTFDAESAFEGTEYIVQITASSITDIELCQRFLHAMSIEFHALDVTSEHCYERFMVNCLQQVS